MITSFVLGTQVGIFGNWDLGPLSYRHVDIDKDILRTIDEKWTLISIIKRKRLEIIGNTLRHGGEVLSLIIKGMIEETRLKEDLGRDTLAK